MITHICIIKTITKVILCAAFLGMYCGRCGSYNGNGSKKLISQLQIGDNIRTEGGTVSTIMNVITGTEPTIYNLKSEDGSEIRATYDHPFLTDSGFVPVSKLDSQTRLKMMDGSFKRLLYCYPQEYNGRLYSLELNNGKTFIAMVF
jgi:preprotein translocase subunit YajC